MMNTSEAKEEYVLVRRGASSKPGVDSPGPIGVASGASKNDLKAPAVDNKASGGMSASVSEGFRAAMSHMKLGARGKEGVFRVNTSVRFTYTSSAATFGNGVESLVPNGTGVTEAANFAALFDEQRCTGFEVYTRVFGKGTFPLPTPGAAWAVVYDPANAGTYSSVVGALVARQHLGPVAFCPNQDAGTQAFTKTGYQKKSFRTVVPVAPTQGAAPLQVGSNWYATTDTTSGIGYLKLAADSLGSGTQSEWDLFVVYHMEYRSRT